MAQLSGYEFKENDNALYDAPYFDVHDWLEAIIAHGVDDAGYLSGTRYTGWYNAAAQARYRLRRLEALGSHTETPYSWYCLQVYPEPDHNFKGYVYRTDTRRTAQFQYDAAKHIISGSERDSDWAEAELLSHLYTAPFERWPHHASRLPNSVVAVRFAKLWAEELDPLRQRQNLPRRLGSLLRRLWCGPFD